MNYAWRLLCLSLASFFLVNAAVGLTTALLSRAAVRMAETMRPRSAARFLFAARMLACALGTGAVLGLCVPGYLWLDPPASSQPRGCASLERCWAKFSEWAADDEAVRGDSQRALALAAALLRVARMGTAPRLSFLHTSLCAGDHDLSLRVERLLALRPPAAKPLSRARCLAFGASLGTAAGITVFLAWPATLSSVHRLLELFLR